LCPFYVFALGGWLRIFSNIIPPKLLINFEPQLREKIARDQFPTYEDTIIFKRDDNGPELKLWKPYTKNYLLR